MKRHIILLLPLTFLFLFAKCGKERPLETSVVPAFYHWKSGLVITAAEKRHLEELGVEKIYLRLFDVDWDSEYQKPLPKAELIIKTPESTGWFNWIPTVFITNQTFINLDPGQAESLADSIFFKISEMMENRRFSEIQIDCDWSQKTKVKYFQFLQHLKAKIKEKQLSVTIRLHQVKYSNITGIPPVDNGVLMFYNMSPVEKWETGNSILNLPEGRKYLYNFEEYSLPLNVALPLFRWGVLFRNGKMIKLINELAPEELTDSSRFQKIGTNRYEVIKSTYLKGYYLYRNDLIRLEKVGREDLLQSAAVLGKHIENKQLTVAFYHLDEAIISRFPIKEMQHVIQVFKK